MRTAYFVLGSILTGTSCGLVGTQADADPASLIAHCLQVPRAAVMVTVGDDGLAQIQFLVHRLDGRQLPEDDIEQCIDDSGLTVR